MAENNDWTKKYLDDLNRKLAEAKKNPPKTDGGTRQDKPESRPQNVHKEKQKQTEKRPEKKPEPRPGRNPFQNKHRHKDQRGPKDQERKSGKDVRDQRRPERRESVKLPARAKSISGTLAVVDHGRYTVFVDQQDMTCTVREGLQPQGPLYVGDQVKVMVFPDGKAVIDRYDPRQNTVITPFMKEQRNETVQACNVNQILLVVSVKEPVLRTDWLDRHLVVCEKKGFKPVLCCTKIDLADDNSFMDQLDVYRRMGYRILHYSSVLPTYINDLKSILKGKVTVVTGHMGCGKTELIRSITARALSIEMPDGDEMVAEDENVVIDEYVETRAVRAIRLEGGGMVIDTPGIREYELYGILKRDLKKYFREFRLINNQCASPHCNHVEEPGCKVRDAVAQNELSDERYQNYLKILENLA